MAGGSSTRAVSITIGYIVLLVALLVIRIGRHQVGHVTPPAETRPVASQPSTPPPAQAPARLEKPVAAATPAESHPPIARSRISRPATPAPPVVAPAAPEAAATTGDVRTTPDVDRTDTALVPAVVPAAPVIPARVGEMVEPIAALPRPAAVPEVREILPADRIYQKESSALARVLGHYEQAYDRLDASSAAAVWPSVDARALSRAFARLQRQDLDFGNCTFSVSASDAAARCAGILRYARRIGDTALKTEQHVWTIEFARAGESWQIVKISAQ